MEMKVGNLFYLLSVISVLSHGYIPFFLSLKENFFE